MMKRITLAVVLVVFTASACLWAGGKKEEADTGPIYLRMYYPVGVAGALAQVMDALVAEFNKSQDEIYVESIFAGGYREALDKALTAFNAGSPPDFAVMDAPNLLTFLSIGAIVPLDEYVEQEGGQAYLDGFTPGFLKVGQYDGKLWSIPFQRSTPILYYNKDFFREAGLDPDRPPQTWDELVEYSQKLTVRSDTGEVLRWGLQIPNIFWVINPLLRQAGGEVENPEGTKISIDSREFKEVYEFLHRLTYQLKVTPGIAPWGQSVADFAVGKTAMLYHTTGSMTYIRNSTSHDFGAAFLPRYKRQVVIEGGGNFFIFKTNPRRQAAAWEAIKWMSQPEITAKWSLGSGYIPVKKAAFNVPEYKAYTDKVPQALVAYRQLLEVDVERNMTTYRMQEIYDLLNRMDERIRGSSDPAMIARALREAQEEANKILAPWQKK